MPPSTSASLYHELTLSRLHLWHIALILLVSLPLAAIAGFYAGRDRRRRLREEGAAIEKVVSDTTMNAFLALLGLLLAFTFGNSLSVFNRSRTRSPTRQPRSAPPSCAPTI
jgi:hypothetical protein